MPFEFLPIQYRKMVLTMFVYLIDADIHLGAYRLTLNNKTAEIDNVTAKEYYG